jgi:hypothetical protein
MTLHDIMVVHHAAGVDGSGRTTPPICPKCGSHRTQVIGASEDGSTFFIRCNSCGERSTVPASPDDRQDLLLNDVRHELATMQADGARLVPMLDEDFIDPFPR